MDSDLKESFVRLVEQHQGIILSLCRAYYQDEEDRHDARQDIILQLWKAFPGFRNECKVSTWMYKVGLNTILANPPLERICNAFLTFLCNCIVLAVKRA